MTAPGKVGLIYSCFASFWLGHVLPHTMWACLYAGSRMGRASSEQDLGWCKDALVARQTWEQRDMAAAGPAGS